MIMDGQVLKTAMAMAGAVGRYQGLIAFVKKNPEAYSHERLLEELFKVDDEVCDKLNRIYSELEAEDKQ
jgi:hypothetical protein